VTGRQHGEFVKEEYYGRLNVFKEIAGLTASDFGNLPAERVSGQAG
jgi:hypothetical protein